MLFVCVALRAQPPNVLFILADDLGWTALSSYGNPYVATPHLDRLAREGARFTQAYVTPQCTPTRAALLTGQHTARNQMWHVIPQYRYPHARLVEPDYLELLPPENTTVAKALQTSGYTTALLGKWHLSNYESGVGYYTRLLAAHAGDYGFDYVDPVSDPSEYQKYGDKGVDFLTDEAIKFMRAHREGPFFCYLSHHTIHGPVLAPPEIVAKYRKRGHPEEGLRSAPYLAALEHLDHSVGRLLDELDRLKLTEQTVVIFLSDNGGVDASFDNAPLRHGKGSPYEGGIRVPVLVRQPKAVAAGQTIDTPVDVVDFYPTLLELANAAPPPDHPLDGVSLVPLLRGGSLDRDTLYGYMPLYDAQWGATPAAVIRQGDYKLIEFFGDYIDLARDGTYVPHGRTELYNLAEDISETNDLSAAMPERTIALRDALYRWIARMEVETPAINPDFSYPRALERQRRR
ncbi:MAG: sulfatase [Catalinimonas sp.]